MDEPSQCTFIAPSIVNRGPVTVAISTGGTSPALARKLRETLSESPALEWADMAIAGGGTTSWELLYMGVPFITGCMAKNQEAVSQALGNFGAAMNIGWYQKASIEQLAEVISSLIDSPDKRANMSEK